MRFTANGAAVALLLASMVPAAAQMSPAPPPEPVMMMGDAWQGFYAGLNVGSAIDDRRLWRRHRAEPGPDL
jgi:hypothetical protein